jgi:hypothetical protein
MEMTGGVSAGLSLYEPKPNPDPGHGLKFRGVVAFSNGARASTAATHA